MSDVKQSNPHAGHRDRMRSRFCKDGGDHFETHELLEMYLFPLLPRRNTNEIAHRLLERFGSLEDVFLADPAELVQIDGISEKTATAIKVSAAMMRRIAQERYHPKKQYEHFEDVARYLQALYAGITVERVYLLLFDNGMTLLDCIMLDEGTVTQANITPRKIVEHAIKRNASAVLISHNHPKGVAIPSSEDVATTNFLQSSLKNMGITLIDHIIVGRDTIMPILNHQMGNLRPSPITGEVDEKFYKSFYGRFDARRQD